MRAAAPILAALLVVAMVAPAGAQTPRSPTGSGDAGRAGAQLQQLAVEKAALQVENAELKRQLEEVQRQYKQQTDQAAVARADFDKRSREVEAAARTRLLLQAADSKELAEKTRLQLTELITRYREIALALREAETERASLRGEIERRDATLRTCVDHNQKLFALGNEILDYIDHRSFWASVADHEPFTRISRTRLQNLIDDYRNKVDDQRLEGGRGSAF